jgi:hypothetical protein
MAYVVEGIQDYHRADKRRHRAHKNSQRVRNQNKIKTHGERHAYGNDVPAQGGRYHFKAKQERHADKGERQPISQAVRDKIRQWKKARAQQGYKNS